MASYAKMYKRLFTSVTQAIEILQRAQQDAEEMYMEGGDTDIRLLPRRRRVKVRRRKIDGS